MASVELERTLVKSPPELWDEVGSADSLSRWLGHVQIRRTDPPHRLEWDSDVASGVIELETAGWGTKVRALAELDGRGSSSETQVEQSLAGLLDQLGSSSLTSG